MATPRMRARVVCTLCVTILTFAPTMRLSKVDLPALGSPIRAMNPARLVMKGSHVLTVFPTPSHSAAPACQNRWPHLHLARNTSGGMLNPQGSTWGDSVPHQKDQAWRS